jgi:heavy metal translocating P-type ATPase
VCDSIDAGILAGLAVVLIACPCAFGLATPMAIWTAMGRAARGHVLFRSGQALEQLARVESMYFDKTGTLTSGDSDVGALVIADDASRDEVLSISESLAAASNHSFSLAIRRYTAGRIKASSVGVVTTIPGKGLSARLDRDFRQQTIYLGSRRLMEEKGLAIASSFELAIEANSAEASFVFIGWAANVQGLFVLREQLRPEAPAALDACRRMGLQTSVLTGDSESRAARLAKHLGTNVLSGQLPEDKVAAVQLARCAGQLVGMVGDGINDAPALAAAEVGIAMGCGADLSRDSAAVCLLSNDLARLPWTISLARRTVRIIHQNLFWAFAYNVVGIGLAVTGRLNPVWAGAAMAASSVLVVTNSLRLNRFPEPFSACDASPLSVRASELVRAQIQEHFDNELPRIAEPLSALQPTP